MRSYARPESLDEAIKLMALGPRRILAGGTDLYPVAGMQLDGDIMDLAGVPGICGITQNGGLRIGACTTWTMIADATLPPALHALQQAAGQVGGRQVQNTGTIGGNLCNASPAADGVPPLLALDAAVELVAPTGLRRIPLAQFLTGPRQTLRAADEILTAVIVPESAMMGRSAFVKLGARAYLVISIAMAAARVRVEQGRITSVALAVGACSGVGQRLPAVEAALVGAQAIDAPDHVRAHDLAGAISPIDDIRATAQYRLSAATELVRRAVKKALA